MPILEIKMKDGTEFQIAFKINELMTRAQFNADRVVVQMFTNPAGTFGLSIKKDEILSVEKKAGIIVSLPNHIPKPQGS